MAFGSLLLSAGFAAALVWQSARGTIVPWVVQVDNLGQTQAVAPATAGYRPTDPQVAWHLARFIEQVRSIPADAIIVRQNWLRAYDFTTDRGAAALNDYARTNDPFTRVGRQQIAVDVSSVIRASPDSFRVAWSERRYENGQLAATERWTASRRATPSGSGQIRLASMSMQFRGRGSWANERRVSQACNCGCAPVRDHARRLRHQQAAADQLRCRLPPLPAVPAAVTDERPRPLHIPPAWTPSRGGATAAAPTARVENANAAARVEPRRDGYYNAIQIFPWSEGALYQVYAAPGQITNIALEPGESLTGAGPIAAGDTTRWIIGDTESGSGAAHRVHVLVKPTRPGISTNLVITTDRRVYMIELRSGENPYMPAVAWAYPQPPASQRQPVPAAPVIPAAAARSYRYTLTGDNPPWRPLAVYDDGRRVYVEFPRGIVQGEMPPLFVIGSDGEPQIVNSRIHQNILIVDRLFGAAELRLGGGNRQQTVRIVRSDGRPS